MAKKIWWPFKAGCTVQHKRNREKEIKKGKPMHLNTTKTFTI